MNLSYARSLAKSKAVANEAQNVVNHFSTDVLAPTFHIPSPIRVVTKVWRYMLLNNMDRFMANGRSIQLKAKSLGAGIYEISIMEGCIDKQIKV